MSAVAEVAFISKKFRKLSIVLAICSAYAKAKLENYDAPFSILYQILFLPAKKKVSLKNGNNGKKIGTGRSAFQFHLIFVKPKICFKYKAKDVLLALYTTFNQNRFLLCKSCPGSCKKNCRSFHDVQKPCGLCSATVIFFIHTSDASVWQPRECTVTGVYCFKMC